MLRRLMHTFITVVVIAYALLVVVALLSDWLIFQPQKSTYDDALLLNAFDQDKIREDPLADAQLIKLNSGDQTITAVYLPNDKARYTLLFSHGNAEDLGDLLPILEMYRDAGFAVFAYDYRGYGTSTGHPSERGVYEDVEAAYAHVTNELRVPGNRVISFGRSVGSGAAIHLAVKRPVAGLIAESPFVSAFRVLTRVPLLPWDKFNNSRLISQIHVPVLVIHGERDNVIPFRNGQRIFELANEPKRHLWVANAGHNDVLFNAGAEYFAAFRSFADSL